MIDWSSLIWTTIRVWKVAIAENGKVERSELLYDMTDLDDERASSIAVIRCVTN